MTTLNQQAKKGIITSVFSNTELDHLFIEVATNLGFADYFSNLKPLSDMTQSEVDICYDRTVQVALAVNEIIKSLVD
jgi:hypothetical protein